MPSLENPAGLPSLPPGWKAVPLQPSRFSTEAALCLVVRTVPDPVAGSLLILRQTPPASVVLGALADSGGRLLDWFELWLQKTDGGSGSNPLFRRHAGHFLLDLEWRELAEDLEADHPGSYLRTPFAAKGLDPVRIDGRKGETVPLEYEEGAPWRLCEDEALLERAGLPSYGATRQRHLLAFPKGKEPVFHRLAPEDVPGAGAVPPPSQGGPRNGPAVSRRATPDRPPSGPAHAGGIPRAAGRNAVGRGGQWK